MPETRHEVEDGRVVYVPPADELHASCHSKLSALLEIYVRDDYDAATSMLTRTSVTDDLAPDASVFLRDRNPETGGRHLEELAFEIINTEELSHAESRARKLAGRGVRRVFAIDVERQRVLEWSAELDGWQLLSPTSAIHDPVFVAALPVEALTEPGKVKDALLLGLIAKGNRVIEAWLAEAQAEAEAEAKARAKAQAKAEAKAQAKAQALAEAILQILTTRGLAIPDELERQVLGCSDSDRLAQWLSRARTARSASELLE